MAIEAARAAGRELLERRRSAVAVERKGRANVTTDADLAAEAAVVSVIRDAFPDHDFLAEESGESGDSAPFRWIIDPLDGTFNYTIGVPLYGVSIAMVEAGRPIVGVVYDPSHDELFAAAVGRGASLNGKPIRADSGRGFADAVLGYDLGYHDERARRAIEIERLLWGRVQLFRCLGSAALGCAYAAAGRFDVYFHHYLSPWDFAAGWLLVEEAGGEVQEGVDLPLTLGSRSILAGNPAHLPAFGAAIAPLGPLPD
ncbi:MAG: inositol monophosphatase family protein [Dehalococcoidia bacterium]